MNSETITVLIPAYNASTTIARAINSILDQTYDQDKIKILVIDDGSKDSTLSVLQKIQKTLPESKLEIISRENKGLSYTRSELVANVHTKWCIFLDADDYYTKNAFSLIVKCIKPDTDLVCSKTVWWRHNTFKRTIVANNFNKHTKYSRYITHADFGYMWNKLYSMKFLKKINFDKIPHIDNITMFEDLYLNSIIFDKKPNLSFCTAHTYIYIITKKNMSNNANTMSFRPILQALSYIKTECKNPFFVANFYNTCVSWISWVFLKNNDKPMYKNAIRELNSIVSSDERKYHTSLSLWRRAYVLMNRKYSKI